MRSYAKKTRLPMVGACAIGFFFVPLMVDLKVLLSTGHCVRCGVVSLSR